MSTRHSPFDHTISTSTLCVRITPIERTRLERIASRECRTVSNLVRKALREGVLLSDSDRGGA